MTSGNLLLQINNLKKYFPVAQSVFQWSSQHLKAVDGVDLYIKEGETLGLVGESGSGKTTVGQTILCLHKPTEGEIWFCSRTLERTGSASERLNLASASPKLMKTVRRDMQMIFQDPYSSLDPRMTVGAIVSEPLYLHGMGNGKERKERVSELLLSVGMKPDHMKRYPHEFSGGQRQRIGIARALALNPQLIIADEPVSALDVSIRAQIINLLEDLQQQFHLTYLFITHDLSVVKHISNRVAVMYLGKIVEMGPNQSIFGKPLHPYTEALISAVPVPDPDANLKRILLSGDIPNPVNPPSGCYFHTRCRYADTICREVPPIYSEIIEDHFAACHFAGKLNLRAFG